MPPITVMIKPVSGARNIRCRSLLLCRRNEAPNKIIRHNEKIPPESYH